MRRGSAHLLRLGALALTAALVASAAWTYGGHSDSSGGHSARASEGLAQFPIFGVSAKPDRAHGDKHGGGATHRRPTLRAARSESARSAPTPAISGPVPAPRPVSTDRVSTDVVDKPVPRPAPQPKPAP